VKPLPPLALVALELPSVDDDLELDQLQNGQEVTVGLVVTNGRGEHTNEADAKFTVRPGAGR
jgi:hypothetical protein